MRFPPTSGRAALVGSWWAAMATAVMVLGCLSGRSLAQEQENQLKAAYLFNFSKFVEWPEGAASGKRPLTICVAGNSYIAFSLTRLAWGKTVNGKEVKVSLVNSPESSGSCQMLFIARAAGKDEKALLERAQNAPVLTVGEEADFVAEGGIVKLVLEGSEIHFEVNQEAAARAGLKVSSKLLALAVRSKN